MNEYIKEFMKRKRIVSIAVIIAIVFFIICAVLFIISFNMENSRIYFLISIIILGFVLAIYVVVIALYANCPKCGKFAMGIFSLNYCPHCSLSFKSLNGEKLDP